MGRSNATHQKGTSSFIFSVYAQILKLFKLENIQTLKSSNIKKV
jgi:GTP cyclohydrolase II